MDPLIGLELDGRYRLVGELGEGAMGKVYRADRIVDGPGQVAVKVLNEDCSTQKDLRERFEREARALFGLQHPHILQVQDFGVASTHQPYLVMELLEGKSLDEMVDEEILPPEQALELGRQLLLGLAHAHAQGVLHRDLKTENVFVVRGPDGRYRAKLLDFGLVKFTDDERWGEGRKLTVAGSVMGSPAYMSPEQATGGPMNARADVYSLGVVLYELVTGHWPFEYESRSDMLKAHLMEPPPDMTGRREGLQCRPELEALVKRALAKEAPDRFMDAQQMLEALDAVPSPAAWLTVQPNQRPLAGGAVPAFDPHMAQLPPAPVQAPHAPTPAPVMAQASMSRPSSKGSTLLIVALAVFLGLAAVGIAGGVVAWFVL